jgi:hypothetical protein
MEPCTIRSTANPRLTRRGWKPRKYLLLPVEGEKCPLTSPLIDRDISTATDFGFPDFLWAAGNGVGVRG